MLQKPCRMYVLAWTSARARHRSIFTIGAAVSYITLLAASSTPVAFKKSVTALSRSISPNLQKPTIA